MGRFSFGRKKSPKKGAGAKGQIAMREQNGAPPMGNQGRLEQKAAAEMNQMQQTPQMARTSLSQLYNDLKQSKRGGLFTQSNSEFYTAVMTDLDDINAIMQKNFTKDPLTNQQILINMQHMYQKLIKSCDAYIARNPSTKAGIHRKELVIQIQAQANSDLVALDAVRTEFCALSPEQQSTKSWNDLLDQARTIRLSVKDFSALGKAEGGQASEVYKLNGSNTNVRNADGTSTSLSDTHFFKNEDEIDMTQKTHASKIVENILKRYPKLAEKEKDIIREWAKSIRTNIAISPKAKVMELGNAVSGNLSSEGKEAVQSVVKVLKGTAVTVEELLPNLELDNEEKVNMSRRNVATSRVAALMGLEKLVAKSQTAEIYDETSGHTFKGNLMEKAKGMTAMDFWSKSPKDASLGKKDIGVNVAGSFQRDMCNLQVLDVICGQVDRHQGNYFVSANEAGELVGVQGIDNDAAFGLNEQVSSAKDPNRHDRGIYDMGTEEMTIPYMDENLAERILQLEPDMLRFALQDLLKHEEIEAVIKRLDHTKAAIRKTKQTQPNRLLKDDEWNDDTAQELINEAWEKEKSGEAQITAHQNYFGGLMRCMTSGTVWAKGTAPQLVRRKKKA